MTPSNHIFGMVCAKGLNAKGNIYIYIYNIYIYIYIYIYIFNWIDPHLHVERFILINYRLPFVWSNKKGKIMYNVV